METENKTIRILGYQIGWFFLGILLIALVINMLMDIVMTILLLVGSEFVYSFLIILSLFLKWIILFYTNKGFKHCAIRIEELKK